uniref:RING-type domain-containing protein n=1 Tax=viral metagenome TaxID=1070528 RepID=A0A6C0IZP3_9ZZZZ
MALVASIPINQVCCAESENECPICFHDMLFPKQVPCCKRRFHEDCLNKWYAKSPTCPNCRASKKKGIDPKSPYFMLQLFYNYYNRENKNMIIPKTVGIDKDIDEICNKYAYYRRIEFIEKYQGKMINELAKLYKNRNSQRFNEEINHYIDNPVPKKRGRPLGSKNKPKNPLEIMVKKESWQEKEKKERENRIVNMIKEYNIIGKRKQQQEELNQAIAKKKEDECIAKEELESNQVKMAGNAALKRAIIGILDKGGYDK